MTTSKVASGLVNNLVQKMFYQHF